MSVVLLALDEVLDLAELADDGPVLFVLLVENLRVLEVVDEAVESLQPRVRQVADLPTTPVTFSLRNLAHLLPWKNR